MSEMGDDDLLNGEDEFDYEGYDIDYAKEEALLQDDEYDENIQEDDDYNKEENVRVDKKETVSDEEDQEDILNLDVEDDFQDVDDKNFEEKLKMPEKRSEEKPEQIPSTSSTTKISLDRGQRTRPPTTTKTLTDSSAKTQNVTKKAQPKNDKFKRGTARGNFHSRSNFNKSEFQRRRNGTVLINPRYQGTVHINDNARLAWDNAPQPPQNNTNFIQPWASTNIANNGNVQDTLISLVSELANYAQAPNMFSLSNQPNQNEYFQGPPPSNIFEPPTIFQPPVNTSQFQHVKPPYSMQNQVSDRQMHALPNMTSQPYQVTGSQNQFTRQISNDRYNSYNERTGNFQSNYSQPQNKSYYETESYERNYSYNPTDFKQNDYKVGNNNLKNYERRNITGYTNNTSNETSYNKPSNYNKYNDNNNFNQINTSNRGPNYQSNFNQVTKASPHQNSQYQSNKGPKNRPNMNNGKNQTKNAKKKQPSKKPIPNENIKKSDEVPEKKVKIEVNINESTNKTEELKVTFSTKNNASTDTKKPVLTKVEEDEDMRLYNLKIEEQKRRREEVLRRKEENRKKILEERTKEEAKHQELQQQQKQNEQQQKQLLHYKQQHNLQQHNLQKHHLHGQQQQQRSLQQQQSTAIPSKPQSTPQVQEQRYQRVPPVTICKPKFELSTQRPKFDRPRENITIIPTEITNLTFEVANDFQTKPEPSSCNFMSNRVVVVKNNIQKSEANTKLNIVKGNEASKEFGDVDKGFSSFFNNRKVLKKDNALLNTRLVLLNNLSTSTDQNKIMAMARGIGEIQ